MHCERTWANNPLLSSDIVDRLIAQCDSIEPDKPWPSNAKNSPFSVFQALIPSNSLLSNVNKMLAAGPTNATHTDPQNKFLFHHYVNHVASVMMPFEHPWNPWKLYYPAVSLHDTLSEEKALYHAILTHAAFNLGHLGVDQSRMMALATRHYNSSIQHLSKSIRSGRQRFSSTLAAIMTLMMAEVYSGQSRKWQHHLQGAWALLNSQYSDPWKESRFACFSTQSLLIVKIISGTSLPNTETTESIQSDLPLFSSPILSTPQCGFTIGAQRALLECISMITVAGRQMQAKNSINTRLAVDRIVADVLGRLEECQSQLSCYSGQSDSLGQELARYQLNAFIFATYIYLHRSLLDVPPWRVAHYVSLTFQNISAFCTKSIGNFSLWPAFIAAVEAYTVKDVDLAQAWLEQSMSFGLGNRLLVKRVVEEVWQRREAINGETGMEKGLITVDWRKVVMDLDVDILLV
ncbi:hypothetical protein ASPWEDRAFT_180214 [Aspergillus wentii DTO 134E9]|uniref:Transcription factor domain-containing protein n=1 Tax=Aspergillus wentii DTO 134E9 TaxID=1073089 RepID=A0A1L9RUV4_ASPWE|nr:uncharacterized protein ASPWEDRAFT_180214 [Aspergillus wentii DTO 134E9]OJJ38699.1 hypothetical protein ASPWEDRAFT_180214 [Aspergillus wentii DTO 134E9]